MKQHQQPDLGLKRDPSSATISITACSHRLQSQSQHADLTLHHTTVDSSHVMPITACPRAGPSSHSVLTKTNAMHQATALTPRHPATAGTALLGGCLQPLSQPVSFQVPMLASVWTWCNSHRFNSIGQATHPWPEQALVAQAVYFVFHLPLNCKECIS